MLSYSACFFNTDDSVFFLYNNVYDFVRLAGKLAASEKRCKSNAFNLKN